MEGRLGEQPAPASRQLLRLALSGVATRLGRYVRVAGGFAYAAWWWVVLVTTASILWPLVVLVTGRARRWSMVHFAGRLLLRLMVVRADVTGTWPAPGTVLLAINHSSYFDSLVLAATVPGEPAFVAKRELDGQLVAGPFLRALGTLFVERDDPEGGVADTNAVLAAARAGQWLAFFPEGTFTRAYGLRPFRLGAFVVAVQQKLAVVPVTLGGTRSILRDGQGLPRHGGVSVHIGEPVNADGVDFAAAVRLRNRVRAAMLSRTDEPDLADGVE